MAVSLVERLQALMAEMKAQPRRIEMAAKERFFVRTLQILDKLVGPDSRHHKEIGRFRNLSVAGFSTDFEADAAERVQRLADYIPVILEELELPAGTAGGALAKRIAAEPKTIFVVHGRDDKLRDAMFQLLRTLGLHPLEWTEAVALTGQGSPYVGTVLDAAFGKAQAVVILLSPDDWAQLDSNLAAKHETHFEAVPRGQARPNVLFEAGLAFGRNADRTVLVEVGDCKPFSDVGGRHVVRFDGSATSRQALVSRLRSAGCDVNTAGTDWLTVGSFVPAPKAGPNKG